MFVTSTLSSAAATDKTKVYSDKWNRLVTDMHKHPLPRVRLRWA